MGTIHIVGAGLAGLSCAVHCICKKSPVILYEASPFAGGRCRSFLDKKLETTIDNGSHILLGGNQNTWQYLKTLGTQNIVTEINPATFPFLKPENFTQWFIKPGRRYSPFWLLNPRRRIPDSRLVDYLNFIRLSKATEEQTVIEFLGNNPPCYSELLEPLCRAVLNINPEEASAQLLWKFLKMSFFIGEKACRPIIFENGLSKTFIDPATKKIKNLGGELNYKSRFLDFEYHNNRVSTLYFAQGSVGIKKEDIVVLAIPPDIYPNFRPNKKIPMEMSPIVNVHFRLTKKLILPGNLPFLGLIGTKAQWIFIRGNILSVTISAATKTINIPSSQIANVLWSDLKTVFRKDLGTLPDWRVIKERRATIAQTPKQIKNRPNTSTIWDNLFLAGDWTDTKLPATIEGGIYSGLKAGRLAINSMRIISNGNFIRGSRKF